MTWLTGTLNLWQDFQRNPAAYTVQPWHVAWQNHLARQPIMQELTPRQHKAEVMKGIVSERDKTSDKIRRAAKAAECEFQEAS